MRFKHLFAVAVSAALFSVSAFAHDPSLHGESQPKKLPKPTTCKQLAYAEHYSINLTDKDIKALKARCDAQKKLAKPAPAKK